MGTHQWDAMRRLPRPRIGADRAQAWHACTRPVHVAATVILVTDDARVWMMRRVATMAFAAGAWVFPGGRVEAADLDPDPLRAAAVREVTEETALVLDPGELRPWARWTTPPGHSRRYDTNFFVAPVAGREPQNPSTEADEARWWRPAELLASTEPLLPPTRTMLIELADHDSWDSVRRATEGRVVRGFTPRLVEHDGRFRVTYPDPEGNWT